MERAAHYYYLTGNPNRLVEYALSHEADLFFSACLYLSSHKRGYPEDSTLYFRADSLIPENIREALLPEHRDRLAPLLSQLIELSSNLEEGAQAFRDRLEKESFIILKVIVKDEVPYVLGFSLITAEPVYLRVQKAFFKQVMSYPAIPFILKLGRKCLSDDVHNPYSWVKSCSIQSAAEWGRGKALPGKLHFLIYGELRHFRL